MVMVYHPYPLRLHEERRSSRRTGLLLACAIGLPLAAGVGYTVDTVRELAVQAKLSQAVDAAALAGGRVMFDDQRDGHIRTFFDIAFPTGFLGAHTAPLAISEDPHAGTLTVSGRATVRALFTRLLGAGDLTVEAHSIVRRATAPGGRKGS